MAPRGAKSSLHLEKRHPNLFFVLKKIEANKQSLRDSFGLDKSFLRKMNRYVKVIDGLELFCEGNICSAFDQKGNPLVVDRGHLSHRGSDILAKAIFSMLYISE